MDEKEQRLLAAAHSLLLESQRGLNALSEEARLSYQRRLGEWEQCRHSLEQMAVLLASEAVDADFLHGRQSDLDGQEKLPEDEALLRDRHGELAEKLYRAQCAVRLLGLAIRQVEKASSVLERGGNGFREPPGLEEHQAGSQDRIIQAHEQERLRLAREIHDGPAQVLANAIFEMEYFERLLERDPSSVRAHMAQLKGDMRDGLAEVRRFIFDLRPPALSDLGLFVALRRYAADFEKHFRIPVEVKLPESGERLPAAKEVALFRIVQEALQNVRKHAGASRIALKAEVESTSLRLSIQDNGRGFDLTEVAGRHSNSFGLISMRERAELANAQLQITTAPGQGTTVALLVPLERGAPESAGSVHP